MKKEQWEIDYSERVKAIQEAIRDGHKFYLTTFIGKLLVNWFDESNAHTGEGFSARTWAICNTHVFRWAEEIGIPKGYHFKEGEHEANMDVLEDVEIFDDIKEKQ